MPGAMRKMGIYLGLVEDDEDTVDIDGAEDYDDGHDGSDARDARGAGRDRGRGYDTDRDRPAGRSSGRAPVRAVDRSLSRGNTALDTRESRVAAAGQAARTEEGETSTAYRITTLHPHTYNEAKTIGEHFREGVPVIMNLTDMDDSDAKRLVDFAVGLSFGLRGSIERVTRKVFLLSPANVEVTDEDKARIAEGGFFNQS